MINNQSISQKRSGQNKMPERTVVHFIIEPGWRNWQTQRTQNPPGFGPWGFDSPSRHHTSTPCNQALAGASSPRGIRQAGLKSLHYAQFVPVSAFVALPLAVFSAQLGITLQCCGGFG